MTTAVRSKKVDYKEFIEMAKKDKFKVEEVSYSHLITDMNYARNVYPEVKKNADKYNVRSVQDLFRELCLEHQEIIDIHTYLDEYMDRVNEALADDDRVQKLRREEQDVYRTIMKLRGYSAYKSSLAEISFKLVCQNVLNDKYEIVMNDDLDRILGVDVALLHKEEDVAHYVHVTKNTKFAHDRLKNKNGQEVTVYDERAVDFLNEEGISQYRRRFKNHVLALYDDEGRNNDIVNGVYIFKKDYVKRIIEKNYGKCNKKQYDELQYLERSRKQVRTFGMNKIVWYED